MGVLDGSRAAHGAEEGMGFVPGAAGYWEDLPIRVTLGCSSQRIDTRRGQEPRNEIYPWREPGMLGDPAVIREPNELLPLTT